MIPGGLDAPAHRTAGKRPKRGTKGRRPGEMVSAEWCRRALLLLLLLVATSAPGVGAVYVSGVVTVRVGERVQPLPRATVVAYDENGRDVLASTKTDAQGRYLISGLPSPRLSLRVQRTGHVVVLAGGREDERVMLNCAQPGGCEGIDFEMVRAGAVTGRVVDEVGEPVEGIAVRAQRAGQDSPAPGVRATTDDRGVFRVANLWPGNYVLRAGGRTSALGGSPGEGVSRPVEVAPGSEVHGVEILLERRPTERSVFRVAGRVAGVDLSAPGGHFIEVDSRGPARRERLEKDGAFVLANLAKGVYAARYHHATGRMHAGGSGRTSLGVLRVDGNREDVLLQPSPPTGMRGKLVFESGVARGSLWLRLSPDGESFGKSLVVEPPEYAFENTNLPPGNYRLSRALALRGHGVFIKEVYQDGKLLASDEVVIAEGRVSTIEVRLSSDFAQVYGRIRVRREAGRVTAGAQYRVGLRSRDETRVVQADQHGGFLFDRVTPGDYRICAWESLSAAEIRLDTTWEEAGEAVRAFPAEAGSDIEIELTAVR